MTDEVDPATTYCICSVHVLRLLLLLPCLCFVHISYLVLVCRNLKEAGSAGLAVDPSKIVWTPYHAEREYANYRG